MTTNAQITNQVFYLRTTRDFSKVSVEELCIDVSKAYLDTANAVNLRTLGIYPTNKSVVSGNSFYLNGNKRQQSLRQVFTFSSTAAITHGITVTDPSFFINCYGSYTNGVNSFGLFFGSSVAIAGQITFYVTPTQIIFLTGAGAPSLTQGIVVIEYMSSV